MVNTSQNLGQMPCTATEHDQLMCLTPGSQQPLSENSSWPRPNGKYLVLTDKTQRYLVGREVLLMMGLPIHRLQISSLPESAPWLNHAR